MRPLRSAAARPRTDPDEFRDLHLRKLRAGLAEVLKTNAFWRSRLTEVRSWGDFERLPLTTKAELLADQASQPPYGTNLTHPLNRYIRLHQTSGSSGDHPLRWLDTAESWDWWVRIWSAFDGAERLRALAISGGAMTSEQRVRTLLDLRATVLMSTPTYALRLAGVADDLGISLESSDIRVTLHAGEPGASIPATRAGIEAAYSAACFDHTGMTELGPTGFSCSQRDGIHAIESEFIFEVLDVAGRPAAEA